MFLEIKEEAPVKSGRIILEDEDDVNSYTIVRGIDILKNLETSQTHKADFIIASTDTNFLIFAVTYYLTQFQNGNGSVGAPYTITNKEI